MIAKAIKMTKNHGLLIFLIFSFIWCFALGAVLAVLFAFSILPPSSRACTTNTCPITHTENVHELVVLTKEPNPTALLIQVVETTGTTLYGDNYSDVYGFAYLSNPDTGTWDKKALTGRELKFIANTSSDGKGSTEILGQLTIGTKKIQIPQIDIQTPMVIKNLEKFSKLGGTGTYVEPTSELVINSRQLSVPTILINDVEIPVDIAYFKATDLADVVIDLDTYGVHTKWLTYWDSADTFYHLDDTQVESNHPTYKPHEFFGNLKTTNQSTVVTYLPIPEIAQTDEQLTINDLPEVLNMQETISEDLDTLRTVTLVTTQNGGRGVYISIGHPK